MGADRSFGGRLATVLIVAVAVSLVGAAALYKRTGRGAAGAELARLSFTQASQLADGVERSLNARGQPTPATQQLLSRSAALLDASIVLFLDADEPLAVAHGPSLRLALPRFREGAPGRLDDSGQTPWVPSFDGPPDATRFPRRAGRLVRVQQEWPFAVELPVGSNLTLRTIPLSLLPLSDGGYRGSLLVLFLVLGLGFLLVALRLARPLESSAVAMERLATGGGWTGPRTNLRELAWIARAGQRLSQRVQDASNQQREVLRALARILVEPVERIKARVESIDGAGMQAQDREALAGAEAEIGAIHRATTALWQWSSMEAGSLEPQRSEVDLRALLQDVSRLFRERRAPDLPIEVLVADEVDATLTLDARLLAGTLASLFDNARLHGAGPVQVLAAREQSKVEVVVRDHGPGVPPEQLADLFQPFRPGHGGGLGLGLRMARQVVALHGGGLTARNHPQGGFEVVFWLPAPPVRVSAVDRSLTGTSWAQNQSPALSPDRPRTTPGAPAPRKAPEPAPPAPPAPPAAPADEVDLFEP